MTERNTSLVLCNNHSCLIWKSNGISFFQAIKELKQNSRIVDNVLYDKHVKSYVKHEYKPIKVQSPLTNVVLFDVETFNKSRAVPCSSCINKLD